MLKHFLKCIMLRKIAPRGLPQPLMILALVCCLPQVEYCCSAVPLLGQGIVRTRLLSDCRKVAHVAGGVKSVSASYISAMSALSLECLRIRCST